MLQRHNLTGYATKTQPNRLCYNKEALYIRNGITFDSEFSVFIFKFRCNLPPKNRTIWYSFSYYSTIFQIALITVYIRVCKDNF